MLPRQVLNFWQFVWQMEPRKFQDHFVQFDTLLVADEKPKFTFHLQLPALETQD